MPWGHRKLLKDDLNGDAALDTADERHMLLECPALADLRDEYSPLVAECSGVMARLVWARNQPMVSRYIIACLDRMSC